MMHYLPSIEHAAQCSLPHEVCVRLNVRHADSSFAIIGIGQTYTIPRGLTMRCRVICIIPIPRVFLSLVAFLTNTQVGCLLDHLEITAVASTAVNTDEMRTVFCIFEIPPLIRR